MKLRKFFFRYFHDLDNEHLLSDLTLFQCYLALFGLLGSAFIHSPHHPGRMMDRIFGA